MISLRTLSATLLGLILLGPVAHAQDTLIQERELVRRNHVSLEVGGNGGIYSLNYERQLTPHFTARVGLEFIPSALILNRSGRIDIALAAPVMLSFVPELVRLWGAPLSAELGAGALLTYSSGTETVYRYHGVVWPEVIGTRPFRRVGFTPTAAAGLRLYVAGERIAFRAGVAVFPGPRTQGQWNRWFLLPLLSVGYRF